MSYPVYVLPTNQLVLAQRLSDLGDTDGNTTAGVTTDGGGSIVIGKTASTTGGLAKKTPLLKFNRHHLVSRERSKPPSHGFVSDAESHESFSSLKCPSKF